MSDNEYYFVEFKIQGKSFYTIWVSSKNEDFFLTKDQHLIFFQDKKELDSFCRLRNLEIESDVTFDFDSINSKDYNFLINSWNIISDLAKTLNISFIGNNDDLLSIYKKILCACNLPALNNTQEKYIPHFSKSELDNIHLVVTNMKDILETTLLLK